MEEIDISDYIGNMVSFRFKLVSDNYVTEDGFYFDDFKVVVVEQGTIGVQENLQTELLVSNPIPNPASGNVRFHFGKSLEEEMQFKVYNATGQIVFSAIIDRKKQTLDIQVENWIAGIYYYQVSGKSFQTKMKKMIVL
jgi:hypothetical protein